MSQNGIKSMRPVKSSVADSVLNVFPYASSRRDQTLLLASAILVALKGTVQLTEYFLMDHSTDPVQLRKSSADIALAFSLVSASSSSCARLQGANVAFTLRKHKYRT